MTEFWDILSGNWQLQVSQISNNSELVSNRVQSCDTPCVRHLYLTPTIDTLSSREKMALQGTYMEFDQDETVVDTLSLELRGFAENNSFQIIQHRDETPKIISTSVASFAVLQNNDRDTFYITVRIAFITKTTLDIHMVYIGQWRSQ